MSLVLSGTDGLSDVDGTAAAPAIRGTDANTGIFFPAADIIAFAEGGAEAMRIDSSGNVGIGTASPTVRLHASGSDNYVAGVESSNTFALLGFKASGSGGTMADPNVAIGATGDALYLRAGGTERARIDSSGNFLSANGAIYFTSAQYRSNVASSQLQFINNASGVSLAVNGTSWGSLSDERDKEIIEPITDAVSKVSTLRSVIGRYKIDDADKRRAFLIAQDVKAVLPEAVTELDDEQKTLILQYTEVIPLLVAAIKEQQTLITALTTRITALEGAAA